MLRRVRINPASVYDELALPVRGVDVFVVTADGFVSTGPSVTTSLASNVLTFEGSTSTWNLAIQDGTGRVNERWNSTAGTSPTFVTGGENALRVLSTTTGFYWYWADGSGALAGDPITWTTLMSITTAGVLDVNGSITTDSLDATAITADTVDVTDEVIIDTAANVAALLELNSSKTGAFTGIGDVSFRWGGNLVARMLAITGSDTANKDEGWFRFDIWRGGTVYEALQLGSTTTPHVEVNPSSAPISFRVRTDDGSYVLFTDPTNNRVGINTAAPGVDLEVNGDIRTDAMLLNTNAFTAATAPLSALFIDSTDQDLKFKFANGVVKTIATN